MNEIALIRVNFICPFKGGYLKIGECYKSTKDEAWIATEALKYITTSIRPIYYNELVWC